MKKHTHNFVGEYDGLVGFGLDREGDEHTITYYLQKFSDDTHMALMRERMSEEDMTRLFDLLTYLLKQYLSEEEYHSHFLKDDHHHGQGLWKITAFDNLGVSTLDTTARVNYNGHKNFLRQTVEEFQHILPVTKVKRDLLNILRRVEEEEATIALTRNGEAVGIMMSLARYDALMETIDILGNNEILKSLEKSKEDFKAGRVFPHEDVWEK